MLAGFALMSAMTVAATAGEDEDKSTKTETPKSETAKAADGEPLFNGKDLTGWKVTNFGGEGEVYVEGGSVVITQGVDLSGVTTTRKDIPRFDYEISFEAQRVDGSDFFVGLTFPVKKDYCSLILGGWGGGVYGLSSLDHMDASENDTTGYRNFTRGQWYKVRLRVTGERIDAWIDDAQIVDVALKNYSKIGVRFEVEASQPLGFATYQTTAKIRNAKIRKLPAKKDGEKPQPNDEK